jgi:helix-turn-helix protein
MASSLSPDDALSPEGFYSLYLGGLTIEDERRKREACYVLLLVGRLGLRVDELTHLHDGWIDYSRGEIHVPARDPCACRRCWQRARDRKREGDSRSLEAIVGEEFWSPPGGSAASRTLAFGWSHRLTAAIDGVLADSEYFDADRAYIEDLVDAAAENAWELGPDAVSLDGLRATAAEFLATAGFGPRRLADLLVVDEATAGAFARVGGGDLREHMYRALPSASPPDICGEDTQYRLVCDPTPFEREPFDPRSYDARWRTERGENTQKRGRNPRPAAVPEDSSFDPATALDPREPAADSGPQIVSQSLAEWVRRRESQREQYGETGDPGIGETAGAQPLAYRDQVTAPVEFSVSTRFAGQGIEQSRPTGGSVVLGQQEIVFLSRDETGIADTLRVPLSSVTDVSPGYLPGPLEGLFEETVGIAYQDDHDERKIIVCELPPERNWEFQQLLFSSLLVEVPIVYANLAAGSGDLSDVEPDDRRLTASPRTLKIEDPDADRLPVRIRLATIVEIEHQPMESEVGYEMGLTLHHLRVNANVVTTELRPKTDRAAKLLRRYLMEHHERQLEKARNASLSSAQKATLDALHDAGDGRELVAILDMNPSRVSNLVASLKELDLVRDSRTGVALTGTGYLVTSGGSLLYEASE